LNPEGETVEELSDEWHAEQITPMSMVKLADRWLQGIKLIGAGNAAGILAVGAALSAISQKPLLLLLAKIAGVMFFIGVLAFALGYLWIERAVFAQDEMAHATLNRDQESIQQNSGAASAAMNGVSVAASAGTICFAIGCVLTIAILILY
jgi:hypothetical protein